MFLISQYGLRPLFVYIALMTQFLCLELICSPDIGIVNPHTKGQSAMSQSFNYCHKNLDCKHVYTNGILFNMLISYITRNTYLYVLYIHKPNCFSLVRSQKSNWQNRLVFYSQFRYLYYSSFVTIRSMDIVNPSLSSE